MVNVIVLASLKVPGRFLEMKARVKLPKARHARYGRTQYKAVTEALLQSAMIWPCSDYASISTKGRGAPNQTAHIITWMRVQMGMM